MTNAEALLAEYGIDIVAPNVSPRPGQTRAPKTVQRIMRRHGEGHLRLVLSTLAETANNKACLDEYSLWMASDMIRARPDLAEGRASDWLDLWDAIPLGDLQAIAQELSGVVPIRSALGGMVYERIVRRFGSGQLDMLDDRRMAP